MGLTARIGRGRFFLAVFVLLDAWNLAGGFGVSSFLIPSARWGFLCICCGVLLATFEERFRKFAEFIPEWVMTLLALVLLLWPVVRHSAWSQTVFDSLLLPPVVALLLAFSMVQRDFFRRFLNWKPVQTIGIMLYGIYLWQEFFTAATQFYTPGDQVLAYTVPLLALVVPLSWYSIEKSAIKLGRSLSNRVQPQRRAPEVCV